MTSSQSCVAIWGTTWLAITYQLGPVAPEVSVSHRFLLAALVIAAWCRLRGLSLRFKPAEHAALALLGFAPELFITVYTLNILYQFWIHTRAVGKLVGDVCAAMGRSAQ